MSRPASPPPILQAPFQNKSPTLGCLERGGYLLYPGACPKMYDGRSLFEIGFHHPPDIVFDVGTTAGSGFSYVAVFESVDGRGKRHVSGVSFPVETSDNPNSVAVHMTVSTYGLGQGSNPVKISIYRNRTGGTEYFFCGSVPNSTVSGSASFTDNVADANLGEPLYTTGGLLENEPLPACHSLKLYQNRIWAALSLQNSYQHFEEDDSGYFEGTSGFYQIQVPSTPVGLHELQNKLLFFTEGGIYMTYGDAPGRTGTDGSLAIPQRILEVGSLNPEVCISDEDGVWFLTTNGLRHINQSLSLTRDEQNRPWGTEAGNLFDSIANTPFIARRMVSREEIWFLPKYNGNGSILVYNLKSKTWSRRWSSIIGGGLELYPFSNYVAPVAVLTNGQRVAIIDEYNVTSGAAIRPVSTFTTPWIRLDGLIGFQRIYELTLLGHGQIATASEGMRVSIAYDYDETIVDYFTSNDSGGNSNKYEMELKPSVQKCEAFKLTIQQTGHVSEPTKYVTLVGMDLTIGLKGGSFKGNPSKRFTEGS